MEEEQKKMAEELLFSEKKKPGFAKQLFFGRFDDSTLFPFPYPNEKEQKINEIFIEGLTQFADAEIDPVWIDRNGTIPEHVVMGLCRLGVLGMTVPQKFGGLGMSFTAYCKATETLASRCASTTLFVNVHQSIGLKSLLLFGTPEQQNQWLPKLASGEVIAAFALTEPCAGSDAAGLQTRAEYDPKKKKYIINGQKQWITNGSIAGLMSVMAKMKVQTPEGEKDKITAFLVSPTMPGFSVTEPALEKIGFRGTRTANLKFENMEVPEENIIGPIGGGLKVALTLLDYGRTTFGALCTGIAKYLVKRAIEHAKTRYQFNRPIGSFGLVKEKIARISALAYAMEATTYMTAGLIDKGVEDVMAESAILKVFASDSLWQIIYDTMQIFGGKSLFTTEPFERILRDSRLNLIGEGSNEVMRAFISAICLRDVGMNLKGIVDEMKHPLSGIKQTLAFAKERLFSGSLASIQVKSPHLVNEAKALSKVVQRLGSSVIAVLAKYGEEVVEKQLDLNRLTTAVMALYTASSVLSKLDSDVILATPEELSVGKAYCREAVKTATDALNHLFDKDDAAIESLSDTLTDIPS